MSQLKFYCVIFYVYIIYTEVFEANILQIKEVFLLSIF